MKIITVGNTLSLFLAITFALCVAWGLVAPENLHMHQAWQNLLPGFTWISLHSFLIGLLGAYLYGWYAALIIVPLHRFFNRGAESA
ncbi:DUF5676 family membrane protein [Parasphingopyxis lamellibrachiae]|uniref:Uncharacterized protein n=1 Tax=Parasphingopyxis lamellibrachiae TaxID=680125 RepID=A0A3D9FHU2_9SPHN|nr:DUF5676 family membrane protein [Parasphingopyxis lamellibrachiae]RED16671.1 hypothetical protein DFR46_1698 [Parasphingopyxis lamellibrachiae]